MKMLIIKCLRMGWLVSGLLLLAVSCKKDQAGLAPVAVVETVSAEKATVESWKARAEKAEQDVVRLQGDLAGALEQARLAEEKAVSALDAQSQDLKGLKETLTRLEMALSLYQRNDLTTPPRSARADVFPIRVFNVNYVFDEGPAPKNGLLKFSIRNVSKTPKDVLFYIGDQKTKLVLEPGGVQTVEMQGQGHQALFVEVNHLIKQFDVISMRKNKPQS